MIAFKVGLIRDIEANESQKAFHQERSRYFLDKELALKEFGKIKEATLNANRMELNCSHKKGTTYTALFETIEIETKNNFENVFDY